MTGAYLGEPRRRPQLYEPADSAPPAVEHLEPATETEAVEATPTDVDPAGTRAALRQRIHARRNPSLPTATAPAPEPREEPDDTPPLPVIRDGGRRPETRRVANARPGPDDTFPARHIVDGGRRPASPLTHSVEETP